MNNNMLTCHGGISVSSVGVLHSSPFYVQPKVNSHGQDEDGEDDDADDHSHQGAVVVAFAHRTCVGKKRRNQEYDEGKDPSRVYDSTQTDLKR